jgi:putative redox protein
VTDGPKTRTVLAVWHGGYRCEVATRNHVIAVDEPTSVGGSDTGPGPTDLLLASLGSCFTLAVSHVAAKRGVELRAVEVSVTGTYSGPAFSDLVLDVYIDADEDRIEELIQRAQAVCYVSNTLVRSPSLSVRRVPAPG